MSRSTGGFMIHLQGETIQDVTTRPSIICHSTGEAEYCIAALAIMAAAHLCKAFNKINNWPLDSQLTIQIEIDSKAAANIASSAKEPKKSVITITFKRVFKEEATSYFISLVQIIGATGFGKTSKAFAIVPTSQYRAVSIDQ
jgi:hypothetical protein